MVRDLDEWKVFQERKEPMRPGENRELLMRVFRLSRVTGPEILMSKYAEFQLRQRITSTNSVKDLYTFERDKNDMVLEVLHSELERIRLETVRHFNQMHSKKTRLLTIEALIEDKENNIEFLKKDILEGKAKLEKRKKKLQKDGKVATLKHLAVLREASKGTYNEIEMVESSPRNVSSSSVLAPFPPGMDYFEMDGVYSKEKTKVEAIISHARRLNRDVRDLNNESLDLQRGVSESEALIRGLKESARKAKKLKLEFLTIIIKHGLDSRDTGVLWMMREIKKLGGDVRGELLPEWIDQSTRDFIMSKFVKFQRASDISEWNSFCLSFFKLLVGDQSHSEQILEEIKLRLSNNKPNPMVNMIAETDSVALVKADDRSTLSQSRRGQVGREALEASLIGENPFLTETSVLGVVEIRDVGASGQQQPVEALDQLAASQSVQRSGAQEYPAQRVTLPVTFDPNLRPDSPSKDGNPNDRLNESLSKLQSSALLGLNSQRSHRVMSPTQRSKRSQMLSARAAEKRKEFLKKGVVYIGDQQYKFPYGNLFGSELLGSGEASELAAQMVSQAIGQDRKRREVLFTQVSMNHESTSMMSAQMEPRESPRSVGELERLKSATSVTSPGAQEDLRLGSAFSLEIGKPNTQRGFSDFEASEDEETDPFDTHVKFFDGDRLINRYPSKQQVIKQIAYEEEEMLGLQDELQRLESQEAERIIRIYRREQAESSRSRYSQIGKVTQGQQGPNSSHIPGVGDVEAVLLPHFQNRSVPEYKVDILIYLSTFMGMKSARQEIYRQDKAEQKRQLIESLRAGKDDKLLRSLLGQKQ